MNLWEAATGTLTNLWAEAGATIGDDLKELTTAINDLAAAGQVWIKRNPELVKWALRLTAGFAALVAGAGAVSLAIFGAGVAMSAFGAVLGIVFSPITLIIAAVAALAGGAVWLYQHWDQTKNWFRGLWAQIVGVFDAASERIGAWVAGVWSARARQVKADWEPIASFFDDLWKGIESAFQSGWEKIKPIVDWVVGAADRLAKLGSGVSEMVGGWVGGPGNKPDNNAGAADVGATGGALMGNRPLPAKSGTLNVKVKIENTVRNGQLETRVVNVENGEATIADPGFNYVMP
jgi:phage-related protein